MEKTTPFTRIEKLYSHSGHNGTYVNSSQKEITPPESWSRGVTSVCYREINFILANTLQREKVCYFEETFTALWGAKKCARLYVISSCYCREELFVCIGKTFEEALSGALNEVAFQVEKYAGTTVGCGMSYQKMLN